MTLTSSVGCGKLIIYFACFWLTALWQGGYTTQGTKCTEYPLYTVVGAGGPLTAARRHLSETTHSAVNVPRFRV